MAKAELGNKRQCQNCGAKFFDLNKDPIICPKCATVFQATPRSRVAAKAEEEDNEVATPAGVEVVSPDEVEASEETARAPAVACATARGRSAETKSGTRGPGAGPATPWRPTAIPVGMGRRRM